MRDRSIGERIVNEHAIATLPDLRHREVLSLRYLHGMAWEDIAERMHYSLRWVFKLHRAALERLREVDEIAKGGARWKKKNRRGADGTQ